MRIDGSVILRRRTPTEVGADFTYARDCMQRSKAIRSVALAAQDAGDSGWRDENTSPRHTVPHPNRHPEAEAQIAAAHQPPDALETAMQTGVDDALEERARSIRLCAHVAPDWDCASCRSSDWGRNPGDPPGTLRRFPRPTTPAGRFDAIVSAVRSGDMPPDVARRALNDPLEDMMRREHAKQASDPGPVFAVDEERPRAFDARASARVCERADLALAMGTLERIAATVMPGTETWTADELQHAVATVQIERDESRAWADQTKPRLEDALAKLRDTSTLEPDDATTLNAFGQTCAALESHAEQGQALHVAYRNALQAVSAMAARRNRGR